MTTNPQHHELAPSYQPPQPFETSLEGWSTNTAEDWPNSVTVTAVEYLNPTDPDTGQEVDPYEYADRFGDRQLVQIDTNYKPTRPGPYPVRLTRTDAARLAARVLEATEDTFHYSRCGRLRANEAAELLTALDDLDLALADLRTHALADLLNAAGLTSDTNTAPGGDRP